jgi:glycosyltransferase involved in cell wall biosynthesis
VKLLYLASDPVPSPKGAGVRIERTVRALVDLGFEVELLSLAGSGEPLAERPGLTHHTVTLEQPNYLERMLAFRCAADGWLAERRSDVIQFRGIWEGIPAVARAHSQGARVVFEAHGFPSIELPYHYPGLQDQDALLLKLITEERAVLEQADLVITHSRTGARYLALRGVPIERVARIPNAVDPELFTAAVAPPPEGDALRVVYVGTLAPWQGLELLLEALARFRSAPPVELHVVGPLKGRWRRWLKEVARRARVHHLLHLSGATEQGNLVPVLHAAHVCAAPMPADARNTVQGCCPVKVLEYMSAARPILATRIPPLLELLKHEQTAWLASPGSTVALAAGLAWMLEHPFEREELGRRAREQVLARFTPHELRARLSDALSRVSSPL